MFVSEIFGLEDCSKYDDATVNNTSKYDTTYSTGQSFSWDSSETAYKLQRTANGFGSILVKDLTVPNTVEISVLFKCTPFNSSVNTQPRLCCFNSNGEGVGQRLVRDVSILSTMGYTSDMSVITQHSHSYLANTWYRLVLTINGNSITAEYYDSSDNLLDSVSGTNSTLASTGNTVGIQMAYNSNAIAYFKNIKVKPL